MSPTWRWWIPSRRSPRASAPSCWRTASACASRGAAAHRSIRPEGSEMADDKKKAEDKQKKHAHGEGPVTDAKAHAEAKKAGGGGKKKGAREQKARKTIQAAEGKAASRGEHPARLGIAYKEQIIPALMKDFGYKNPMQVPKVEKVVVNMGLGEAITNNKLIEQAEEQMMAITGQKAVVTRSRKSIANF